MSYDDLFLSQSHAIQLLVLMSNPLRSFLKNKPDSFTHISEELLWAKLEVLFETIMFLWLSKKTPARNSLITAFDDFLTKTASTLPRGQVREHVRVAILSRLVEEAESLARILSY